MNQDLIEYIQQTILEGRTDVILESDTDLLSSGLLDSISVMKLISFIETKYGYTVPAHDMIIEHFITVEAISSYLNTKSVA